MASIFKVKGNIMKTVFEFKASMMNWRRNHIMIFGHTFCPKQCSVLLPISHLEHIDPSPGNVIETTVSEVGDLQSDASQ
jgi:hypothetical protein